MEKANLKPNPKERIAHSTVRKNLSDYNDGANVTDQLGNDEQNENFGTFYSGPPEADDIGEVAYGNEATFEENDVEDMT
jgi:hypothetical protein